MKKLLTIFICTALGGCAGYNISHLHGIVNGNQVKTQYGILDGNATIDSFSCFGTKCPTITNVEVVDAANSGSPNNTGK